MLDTTQICLERSHAEINDKELNDLSVEHGEAFVSAENAEKHYSAMLTGL
jgi:hypothetical protein